MSETLRLIIGTYTDSLPHVDAKGRGIVSLELEAAAGMFREVATFAGLHNPTYLALSADRERLYAVEEMMQAEGSSAAVLKRDIVSDGLSLQSKVSVFGDAPCHISLDNGERRLFIANYVTGNVAAYGLDDNGVPEERGTDIRRSGAGPNPERQEGPHAHQCVPTPDGRHILVCDAGTDEIARYQLTDGLISSTPDLTVKAKPGTLPRHLVFTPDGGRFFVVHELGCAVSSYAYSDDTVTLLGEASTLPPDYDGNSACAAIRLHPNGRFLYASNRGHDSIAAFDVSVKGAAPRPVGWFDTRGKAPRDFGIDPSGRYLVAANQDSHSLAVFSIDGETGALTAIGEPFAIGSPVCVLFA